MPLARASVVATDLDRLTGEHDDFLQRQTEHLRLVSLRVGRLDLSPPPLLAAHDRGHLQIIGPLAQSAASMAIDSTRRGAARPERSRA